MIKNIEQLSKEDLQRIIKRVYENHANDLKFYEGFQHGSPESSKLLAGMFRTRVERIDLDIANALKNKPE